MERRSHRFAVLAMVVLLHVPVFLVLRDAWEPSFPRPTQPALRVEFVLDDRAAAPPPMPRRHSRRSENPGAKPVATTRESAAATQTDSRVRANDAPRVRLFSDDGTLRIPSTLADDIADNVVEGPGTFHLPAGDAWVLREPRSAIDYDDTRFAQAFLPAGMNPVEEACWRNKGFAFIMTMLGSRDCADPGGKDPRPTPAMIVHGVDDADDILRKTEDWARYNAR